MQGFATGLFTDPSAYTSSTMATSAQQSQLLQYSDWILVGLTGNLRDYTFTDSAGATVTGAEVNYNGQPTGYTKSPIEAINYASVHDNQDLFDQIQLKSSYSDTIAMRARRQVLGMSLVTLGEGFRSIKAATICCGRRIWIRTATTPATGSTRSTGAERLRTGESGCRLRARTNRSGRS